MRAAYRFLDRWVVPHPVEDVYDLLGEIVAYPEWWPDVFLRAEGDAGAPEPGKRVDLETRGYLPYRLRYSMECVEAERPTRVRSRLSGDFEGVAEWNLRSDGDGTIAELTFEPVVNKPGVRELTPVLRPLFRSNHVWAMRRGQRRILERLASTSAQA